MTQEEEREEKNLFEMKKFVMLLCDSLCPLVSLEELVMHTQVKEREKRKKERENDNEDDMEMMWKDEGKDEENQQELMMFLFECVPLKILSIVPSHRVDQL